MWKNNLLDYFNPLARLGNRKYSRLFPLVGMVVISVVSEIVTVHIFHNPSLVEYYVIVLYVALVVYFAFRDGLMGGFIATTVTITYYFYIIYSRHYEGDQLSAGVEASLLLAILYYLISAIIGWLKEKIDFLIEEEKEARLSAEEGQMRLQTILQQLPVGVILADAKNFSMVGNRYVEKILGRKMSSHLEINDTYVSTSAYRDEKPLANKDWPIVRAIKDGESVVSEDLEYIREDRKRLFLRVNATPIRNKKNQIIAAVSTVDDITQEKELEQRKEDFINMASHELKTPITSIKLYVDLLINRLRQHEDAQTTKMLKSMKGQVQRLQELVTDLLDMSRIQTGKLTFSKEDFELREVVTEAVNVLQQTTRRHRLNLETKSKLMVFADRFRIYQVITNLLTNAIKYSPAGTNINISVKREGDRAVVRVQDFGIGVAKEDQKKIFERLYQVTNAASKSFAGLGMGLYISKEIVKRHRGSIWVESDKGRGSSFYFSLPLKK